MKKYISFLRMKFIAGVQYRAAAFAGILTQYAWGGMEILIYRCFYLENKADFPMQMQALSNYIWLQQGFLTLFAIWIFENEIFEMITQGNIAYELCRPCDLYYMWMFRGMGMRLSRVALRCIPVFVVAVFLPAPYGLKLPPTPEAAVLFLISGVLGFLNVMAFGMLIYISTFFTISVQGTRAFCVAAVDLLSGKVIPIPFLPDGVRQVVELLPFASMENAPLRIYGGDIAGAQAVQTILLQLFWFTVMTVTGKLLMQKALREVVVQGG